MIWAAEGSPHRNEVFSRGLFTRALDVRSVSSRGAYWNATIARFETSTEPVAT